MKQAYKFFLFSFLFLFLYGIYFVAQAHTKDVVFEKLHELAAEGLTLDARTKEYGCTVENGFPDHECTPGAIFVSALKDDICVSGYSRSVRNVSPKKRNDVYLAYGITTHAKGEYEVDHFISLELGGSNDIANLFPEAAEPSPGFHEKDEVENFLHKELCTNQISLSEAQVLISKHWIEVYHLLHSL